MRRPQQGPDGEAALPAPLPPAAPGPRTGPLPGGRTRREPLGLQSPLLSAAVCVCQCERRARAPSQLLLASGSSRPAHSVSAVGQQGREACSQVLRLQEAPVTPPGLCGRVSSSRGNTGHCCVPSKGV